MFGSAHRTICLFCGQEGLSCLFFSYEQKYCEKSNAVNNICMLVCVRPVLSVFAYVVAALNVSSSSFSISAC